MAISPVIMLSAHQIVQFVFRKQQLIDSPCIPMSIHSTSTRALTTTSILPPRTHPTPPCLYRLYTTSRIHMLHIVSAYRPKLSVANQISQLDHYEGSRV